MRDSIDCKSIGEGKALIRMKHATFKSKYRQVAELDLILDPRSLIVSARDSKPNRLDRLPLTETTQRK